MSEVPKVTIIMPSLNVVSYIDRAVESALGQTMREIEVLCVDAGSTDGTLEKLQGWSAKDSRLRLIRSEKKSYGYQMNLGLQQAKGDFIGILETDDYLEPGMMEELYAIAQENQLDFVKADYFAFGNHPLTGKEENYHQPLTSDNEAYGRVRNASQEPEMLRYIMFTWSGIYRRSFLEENHIRYHESPGASYQDNGFFFQTFVRGQRMMLVKKPYYHYRKDNPGSSVNSREKVYDMNREYAFIRELLQQDDAVWQRFRAMYWWRVFISYQVTMERIAPEFRADYAKTFRQEMLEAQERGELDRTVFNEKQLLLLDILLRDSDAFTAKIDEIQAYERYLAADQIRNLRWRVVNLQDRNEFLRTRIDEIKASRSYRVGQRIAHPFHREKKQGK